MPNHSLTLDGDGPDSVELCVGITRVNRVESQARGATLAYLGRRRALSLSSTLNHSPSAACRLSPSAEDEGEENLDLQYV